MADHPWRPEWPPKWTQPPPIPPVYVHPIRVAPTIGEMRVALAATLTAALGDDYQVTPYAPDSPSGRAAWPRIIEVEYATGDAGLGGIEVTVLLVVTTPRGDAELAQEEQDLLMSGENIDPALGHGLVHAFDNDPTLGGNVRYCQILSATTSPEKVADATYGAVGFAARVLL